MFHFESRNSVLFLKVTLKESARAWMWLTEAMKYIWGITVINKPSKLYYGLLCQQDAEGQASYDALVLREERNLPFLCFLAAALGKRDSADWDRPLHSQLTPSLQVNHRSLSSKDLCSMVSNTGKFSLPHLQALSPAWTGLALAMRLEAGACHSANHHTCAF
jgi:hypothetical protein